MHGSLASCVAGACPGSLAVPLPGGRFTVTLGANVETGSCGGAGSEAYLAFAVTAVSAWASAIWAVRSAM